MTVAQLTTLFQWMMIINIGVLAVTSILLMVLKHAVCRMHGRLFGLKEDQVAMVAYGYLGFLKALIIVFNIVPYVALHFI